MNLMWVALGGALGALARFALQNLAGRIWPHWPWGTLLVNACGSFAIGVLAARLSLLPPWTRPLIMVGFLGGLTTMSSFALEAVLLWESRRLFAALAYWLATLVLCTGLAFLGYSGGEGANSLR